MTFQGHLLTGVSDLPSVDSVSDIDGELIEGELDVRLLSKSSLK